MSKSVLRLRELDAQSTQDEPLLELFQQSRKSVLRVATSPLQPNDLIVTTENGFIELVHVSSGEFRLFITHLQSMPLNAAIRCLSLAPCLTILTKRLHVVYSLSYSNEVLVTDINSGSVTVLAALSSRPSTVDCDGDYIACGEGSGQISVWRATAEAGEPQPLWTAPIFNDVVSSLLLLRDRVICCCADFTCSVVHVDTGATLSTISHDPDYVVAVMPMTHPVVCHAVLGVCLRHSICVYSEQASDTRTDALPPEWRYCGCEPLEVEVRAATCLDGYMAVGTLSGEVVLYQCDAVSYDVTEVARFDVGFGVVQLQLYPNSTLLVVTNVGDVWNWTLEELLAAAKGDAAEESSHVVEGVNDMTNPLSEPPCPIPYDADAVDAVHASEAEADPLDKRSIGTTSASGARNKSSNSNSSQRGSVNSSYRDAEEVVIIDVNCSGEDEDESVSPIPNPCTGSRSDGVDEEPKKLSGLQQQTEEDGALAVAAVEHAQSNEGADAHHSAATLGEGPSSAGPMTLVKPSPQQALLAEACELLSKELGPVAEIGGLRQGKRLDPRKIEAVLENYYLRTGGNVDEEGPLMPEELHSTRLLREQQVVLAEVPFDYDAFVAEHPLEAAALPYQHPVVLPAYRPEKNVYQGISAPNTQQLMGSEGPPDSGDTLPVDPLMDATYLKFSRRKDPELEEERRRGGPNIWEHPCRHLLFPTSDPSSTVLFTEYHMKPAPAGALMLPMPLPPTSSVF